MTHRSETTSASGTQGMHPHAKALFPVNATAATDIHSVPAPAKLFVETTTRCNMQCAMCVKQTEGCAINEADLALETFHALTPALADLDLLVLNGIGEPLLHPELESMISHARQHMPQKGIIGFQSNGLLLNPFRADKLLRAGLDTICLSIDSLEATSSEQDGLLPSSANISGADCSPNCSSSAHAPAFQCSSVVADNSLSSESSSAPSPPQLETSPNGRPLTPLNGAPIVHGNDHVPTIERTIAMLRQSATSAGRDDFSIGAEFVLMRDNMEQLPHVVRWAAKHNLAYLIVTHVMAYAAEAEAQSAFSPDSDATMALLDKWKSKATAQGLDLGDYLGTFWKFHKTPQQEQVIKMVHEMRDEAAELGLPLNIKRVLSPRAISLQTSQRLEQLFTESQLIAEANNIRLQLPERSAQDEGHCAFIDTPSMFISVDGDVHGCYFLWHRYSCYLDGEPKQVFPQPFGNVREENALDIWRNHGFRTFRKEAEENHYADCFGCQVAPCDDITGSMGEFDIDCHGSTVPCGYCPWRLGGLQCLS